MKRPNMKPKLRPIKSIYMMLISFMFGIMIMAWILTAAAYVFLMVFGFLANPHFRVLAMPTLLVVFIMTLSVGVGRTKLRPMNDLMHAMHDVSQGDFSVRVHGESMPGEMGELVSSFNDMAQELGGLEMFRKDFINNFSHEFKTPIVSIRGFAKQLQRDDLTDVQRQEYMAIIISESDRLANMASNVLLLTKLENQQIVTDKMRYRLDEQLRNCILLMEKQWEEKQIELDLDLDELEYLGNEEMVAHIWVNLINNAIKFSPQGAPLAISVKLEGGSAVVRVRDVGMGMDPQIQNRIFEKFYQGDAAHNTEGNGLGLSLVKRIVDLCGGTVEVASVLGEGTMFTVHLPQEIQK